MPVSGGSADKLGNRYEALWAIDQLLQIVDGAARELTLEPLDPDESRGVELVVVDADDTSCYWSVKRQTTKAAGWTLSALCAKDDRGRTILGDLLGLPIRFDQLPEGILTTTELGRRLLLPESPAMVLAGVARGAPSVLVIDQLDAVSLASGRRAELWSLFDRLYRESKRFPSMSMVVGCRDFDLEHDYTRGGSGKDVRRPVVGGDEEIFGRGVFVFASQWVVRR